MTTAKTKALHALRAALAMSMTFNVAGGVAFYPTHVSAAALPNPYVSHALHAVLLPIDAEVIAAFGLDPAETGLLVLAVQPGGVADAAGIVPGDVISTVHGKAVTDPLDLDAIVYYWITQGMFDFGFDLYRAGAPVNLVYTITLETYSEVFEISSIESWTAYSSETFVYSEFYSEYSSVITESWESSETLIEETVTSEEFTSEMSAEESGDVDGDGIDDAEDTDDDNDGIDDAEDTDDDNDGTDDTAEAEDDSGDDAGDEGGDDGGDEGGDEGGDDGGDDVVEE